MTLGCEWVLEGLARRKDHPKPIHDSSRAQVVGRRYSDDVSDAEPAEAVCDDSARCFRRVALAPVIVGETPGNLDVRYDTRIEIRAR
jgi:hypothetical protein